MARGPLIALAFGCGVALLVFYGGELGLRLADQDPGRAAIREAARAGRPFDSRSRREVVAELRAEGRDAVPRLVPSGLLLEDDAGVVRSRLSHDGRELLPLAGISSRTTVLCNEAGNWATYESDEHGFRNPKGIWRRARVDLVLLGDSFTIGECVGPGQTVADRLRERRPATLNLGYSGNSPLIELATLAEYGPSVRPRVTLWLYFENDLSWFDMGRSQRSPLLMRYLEGDELQGLRALQPTIDALLESLVDTEIAQPDTESPPARLDARRRDLWAQASRFLALRTLRDRLAALRGGDPTPREPPDYGLLSRVLTQARHLVSSWQGELVVVYLPGVWNFDPRSRGPAFADPAARKELRSIASANGLRFVDVHAAFDAHPDPLSLYSYRGDSVLGSPHMNAEGYARVAATIERELAAQASARRSQISRQ